MSESDWLSANDPTPMLEFLLASASLRKQRLFAVACCNRVRHLLVDERSRNAVALAERFANGAATEQELEAASQVAWEFTLHTVHDNEAFFDLDDEQLNAADVPAWTADLRVEPVRVAVAAQRALGADEGKAQADLLRCVFGNPFRPVSVEPFWRTLTVISLAEGIYAERDFGRMPILGDALQDAGCEDADILNHLRGPGPHVRGCWLIDMLTGRA